MEKKPPIVIICWNRPDSMRRLLDSVGRAEIPFGVDLYICIDGDGDSACARLAEDLEWPNGNKRIIQQEEHLGLKNHVLQCGDICLDSGAAIYLEDDLLVSPSFYSYSFAALDRLGTEEKLAGVSLYSYSISENRFLPFIQAKGGHANYFMQFPSSWGQIFLGKVWKEFRKWIVEKSEAEIDELVPDYVSEWGRNSWKRMYLAFMIDQGLTFAYPVISQTTNYSEPGTNSDRIGAFQVPLAEFHSTERIVGIDECKWHYDAWFEPTPETVLQLVPDFPDLEFEVDFFGNKERSAVTKPYLLTTRDGENPIASWDAQLVPLVSNIVNDVKGDVIKLLPTEQVDWSPVRSEKLWSHLSAIAPIVFQDSIEDAARDSIFPAEVKMAAEDRANVIANERFLKWVEEENRRRDHPSFGIAVVGESKLTQTEESRIAAECKDYPNTRIIDATIPKVFQSDDELYYLAFMEAGAWIDSELLHQVNSVFKRFPHVNVLFASGEKRLSDNRIRFHKQKTLSVESVVGNEARLFLRKPVLENVGEVGSLEDWLKTVSQNEQVYAAQLGSNMDVESGSRSGSVGIVDRLLAIAYRLNIPVLRTQYLDRIGAPDLIRKDENGQFYMSRL